MGALVAVGCKAGEEGPAPRVPQEEAAAQADPASPPAPGCRCCRSSFSPTPSVTPSPPLGASGARRRDYQSASSLAASPADVSPG